MTITSQEKMKTTSTAWGHPREWPRRDLRSPDDCLNIDQAVTEELQLKVFSQALHLHV